MKVASISMILKILFYGGIHYYSIVKEVKGPSFFIRDAGITFPEIQHFRYFMEPLKCTCHVSGFCANNLRSDAQTDESIRMREGRRRQPQKYYSTDFCYKI